MKPSEPVDTGQHDMFRSRLDQIIHMGHEKVVLADRIDWQSLSDECGQTYTDKPGHPALSTRLPLGGAMLACRAMNGGSSYSQVCRQPV